MSIIHDTRGDLRCRDCGEPIDDYKSVLRKATSKAFVASGPEFAAALAVFRKGGAFSDYADVGPQAGLPTDDSDAFEVLLVAPGACARCGGGRMVWKVHRKG